MAEKIVKNIKTDDQPVDDRFLDIEIESYVLASKEKALNNHFNGLMTELLNWERKAPEVEISKKR